MMFDVKLSKQAELDLVKIYEYIAFTLQAQKNANHLLERIETMIFSLATMPERFGRK